MSNIARAAASNADLIVFSSAIKFDNPILVSARDSGKPVGAPRRSPRRYHAGQSAAFLSRECTEKPQPQR